MSSRQYFDEVAGRWDGMREVFFSEAVRQRAISAADVQAGAVAADIGAGSGFVTEGLLAEGLRVIAVDQSEAMLEEIKRKFSAVENLDCRIGEAEQLPIDSEAVDYVFANMYLHHVDSPPRAIREMVRVLKAGGTVVLTDLDEHAFEFLRTEQHDRWLGFNREDVEAWLRESGLIDVFTDCVGEDCSSDSESGAERARINIFLAYGRKAGASGPRSGREGADSGRAQD